MVSENTLTRIISPIVSGLKHIFFKPITIKYPYEKTYNIPESNYRFDPKEGIAYPGYKGRHILYLDKCTGCGACDRACENISEAISMVFGYDVSINFDSSVYERLKEGAEIAKAVELLANQFSGELKSFERTEQNYILRMNKDPIFNYRCEVIYENLLEDPLHELIANGWSVELVEYKPVENMKFKISKDTDVFEVLIMKKDFGLKQNKRSTFPAIDYGRCLPPWTPVFTAEDIKPIEEVRVGDSVLTHTGRFKKVTRVFERSYTGPLYTFKTLGNIEPLTVTEDHPILTYFMGTTRWTYPREIGYGTYLVRPIPLETFPHEKMTFYQEQPHTSGRNSYFTLIRNDLSISSELMKLIGYYIVGGELDEYEVYFNVSREEWNLAQEIISASEKIFHEEVMINHNPRSGGFRLAINSVKVSSFFKQFGMRSDLKRLPRWVFFLPIDLQEELIRTLYFGGVHYADTNHPYVYSDYFVIRTGSRILASQLLYILARLGIVASVFLQKQEDGKDRYTVRVDAPFTAKMASILGINTMNNDSYSHIYSKIVDGRMIVSPVVDVHVDYVRNFRVYNLEVEEDQSYVASNQVVHNCVFCGFCVDACPFYALEMGPSYELSTLEREELFYTPLMLSSKFFETYPPETTWSEKTLILFRRFR